MVTATWTSPGQTLTADFQVGISEAVIRAEVGTGLLPGVQPSDLAQRTGDVTLTDGQSIRDTFVHGRIIRRGSNCAIENCAVDGGTSPASNTGLIDANGPGKNLQISHVRLIPATPNIWVDGLIGHDYQADHVFTRGCVDGLGFYSTTAVNVDVEWAVAELLYYGTPDPNHSSDNHTHNDGAQGQGGVGGNFRNVVFAATIDPAIGQVSPYAPNATGQAFTVSPNVAQVSGLTLTDVHLHGGAAGFIAILGSKGTPTASLGTFTRVTVYPDQHLVGGVRRPVVIDPAYTWSGGFQTPDGTPITPTRAAS